MMHQLKKDFLLYGEYEVNSTENIMNMFHNIDKRTSTLEYWIEGGSTQMAQAYWKQATGPTMYSHQLQLYLNSLEEKYIRLYEALVTELRLLLRSISILSKGHLPPQLFPPSTLKEISEMAIQMIGKENPDYVLALPHLTDYYDIKLVTFALDEEDRLVICFPIFVKDYKREPMTLYQIETVKVPILDKNPNASSYTELSIQKPYIASNKAYYIQLVLPELVMCKKIRHTYYCEELFLVKHKTKHSCESAIFYHLPRAIILQNCEIRYFYNTTVLPSVLDGGSSIVLANMLNEKRLICSYDQGLATPLPTSSYALVSRDILCHCHLQVGLTYVLKSVVSCNASAVPVLQYTSNLAFLDHFHSFWSNNTIPLFPTWKETILPLSLEDFSKDPDFSIYGKDRDASPTNMKALTQLYYQKQLFLQSRKKLFSEGNAGVTPKLPKISSYSKSSFLFTIAFHIYAFVGSSIGIILIIPYVHHAIKHRRAAALLSAMTLYRAGKGKAAPIPSTFQPLTAVDIPIHPSAKLICHDPWVSFLMATITVLGIILYLYKQCKDMTLIKGHKFAGICKLYLIVGNSTRYVPLLIGQGVGSPFLFKYNQIIPISNMSLEKQLIWDHVHLNWDSQRIKHKNEDIPLKQHISVPLKEKIRLRQLLTPSTQFMYMVKQGNTWYNLKHE